MIIVLKPHATKEHADELMARISALGLRPLYMPGEERVVLGALGDERALESLHLDSDPMVESVKPILAPYKLVGREMHPHDTIVDLGGVHVGGGRFTVIAANRLGQLYDGRRAERYRRRRSRRVHDLQASTPAGRDLAPPRR